MAAVYSVRTIDDLKSGNHLCFLYETDEQHQSLLTVFLLKGLERNEKILYVVDTNTGDIILGYLQDAGVDPGPYLESGQLNIVTSDDSYTAGGAFDPDRMLELIKNFVDEALEGGYRGARLTGEMSWALKGIAGSERLVEYEAKLNDFPAGVKSLVMCQYDMRLFDSQILLAALVTHPIVAIGSDICDNFFYVPSSFAPDTDLPHLLLRNWLQALKERKAAESRRR